MNYKKDNPCPICGGTDWCGYVKSQNGYLVGCHRILDLQRGETITGQDGETYYHVYTKNGTGVYEIKDQYESSHKRYLDDIKERNIYKRKVSEKSSRTALNEKTSKPTASSELFPVRKAENERESEFLDTVYREFIKNFILSEKHKNDLLKDGWTEKMIESSGYISIDNTSEAKGIVKELSEKFDLSGVPGFYKKEGEWTANLYTGMYLPVYNLNKQIIRLRIKTDFGFKTKAKYLTFSSYKESQDGTNAYDCGCRAHSRIDYEFRDDDTYKVILVTEGEKKAKVVNEKYKVVCAALPGVMTYSVFLHDMDELIKRGMEKVIIAYDADLVNNKSVKKAEEMFIRELQKYPVEIFLARWDLSDGKGIDDLLLNNKKPKLIPVARHLR